jgi:hypothetical protein
MKHLDAFFRNTLDKIRKKFNLRCNMVRFVSAITLLLVLVNLVGCEKDFDIKMDTNESVLVVEGYITNHTSDFNYVVLSRSRSYFSDSFQSKPVPNATVYITEGEYTNNTYHWNEASKVQLTELNVPRIPINFRNGVYFDPKLITNPSRALRGKFGKSYLLEISEGGNRYSAITTLLNPVKLDSLTTGYPYTDPANGNKTRLRVTLHYKDPDTLNNTQLYYSSLAADSRKFGWGSIFRSRSFGTDDLTNGQYMHLTPSRGFLAGDTVTAYMASVTRDVHSFWQSFNNARDNNGPFATPVTLYGNITGNNVTGCFSGLSLSAKTIVVR